MEEKEEMKVYIGMKSGKLTVTEEAPPVQSGKHTIRRWLCQCECGNSVVVRENNLLYGKTTKSCGCLKVARSNENVQKAHNARRKHFGCTFCGSDEHYAKGLCRNCYNKMRRGTLYKEEI